MLPVLMVAATLVACKTAPDGKRVVDIAKVADARDAITPVASGAIRRVLVNSPEHAPLIARYVSAVAGVFCTMSLSNEFRPQFLIDELNKLADPELAKLGDGFVLDLKNSAASLYKILWRDAGRAEIPPDQWLHLVSQFFCEAINQGLTDAGYPGGVRTTGVGPQRSALAGGHQGGSADRLKPALQTTSIAPQSFGQGSDNPSYAGAHNSSAAVAARILPESFN